MKTTIDLTQFDFGSRIFNQISDCPDTGFIRVLVYTGDNYQEKINKWFINAEIHYINSVNNKVVYIKPAKSKNQDWVISNEYEVTLFNIQNVPIVNPEFNTEDEEGNPLEISENNLPYLTLPAFDRFSEFRVGNTNSLTMRQLWNISVASDDANEYFDEKENHKTLVDIQKKLYTDYHS